MERQKLAMMLEIMAGISFIIASLFWGQITGAVIGTSPSVNEKIGGVIFAIALVLTAVFVLVKWKK